MKALLFFLCVVFILRINVTLPIYFYLDLKHMWSLTAFGEGGKMDRVLVMQAVGNAALKVNSIEKSMSFSFSFQ